MQRRGGLTSQGNIVEVHWELDRLDLTPDIVLMYFSTEVRDGGVRRVVSPEDVDRLLHLVGAVDVLHWCTM